MKLLNCCLVVVFLQLIVFLGEYQIGFALVTNNPFVLSNAKIKNVKAITSDGKFLVELEYSPELAKKGQVTFLKINLFDNVLKNDTMLRHVDCDLTIMKDNIDLFTLSSKYGEQFYHSISGTFLASYQFNEAGAYKISIKLAGVNFVPITPVVADFGVTVPNNSSENLKIDSKI